VSLGMSGEGAQVSLGMTERQFKIQMKSHGFDKNMHKTMCFTAKPKTCAEITESSVSSIVNSISNGI